MQYWPFFLLVASCNLYGVKSFIGEVAGTYEFSQLDGEGHVLFFELLPYSDGIQPFNLATTYSSEIHQFTIHPDMLGAIEVYCATLMLTGFTGQERRSYVMATLLLGYFWLYRHASNMEREVHSARSRSAVLMTGTLNTAHMTFSGTSRSNEQRCVVKASTAVLNDRLRCRIRITDGQESSCTESQYSLVLSKDYHLSRVSCRPPDEDCHSQDYGSDDDRWSFKTLTRKFMALVAGTSASVMAEAPEVNRSYYESNNQKGETQKALIWQHWMFRFIEI